MNNFTTLAFSPLGRLNEVSRYSSVYQECNESLSEHTADVSMMSYLIARTMNNECYESLDIGTLLEKCLLHDIDESITGDVPRNTKYATNEVHETLDTVASRAVSMIEGLVNIDNLQGIWSTAKEGKEGLILKVSDILVVVKKCITEISLRGNLSFLKVAVELEKHLKTLRNSKRFRELSPEARKYLVEIIDQATEEIVVIRVKYQDMINKYHIRENVIEGDDEGGESSAQS